MKVAKLVPAIGGFHVASRQLTLLILGRPTRCSRSSTRNKRPRPLSVATCWATCWATWDVETESNLQVISSDLEDLLGAWAIYQHGLSSDSSWSFTSPPRKALETAEGSAPTWVSWRHCRNMKSTPNPEKNLWGVIHYTENWFPLMLFALN